MAARSLARAGVIAAGALAAAGCAQRPAAQAIVKVSQTGYASPADRECLARAMYFESHRGSDDGMLAVGTVVANRVKSGQYGSSYCEVVGQKRQFADGVLSRTMDDSGAERARRAADAIIAGKRHPGVHDAMHFHTAGLRFPYPNMRYVLVAGGNAFYEKRSVATAADVRENAQSRAMALAYAKADPTAAAKPIMTASLAPRTTAAAPVVLAAAPRALSDSAPVVVAQVGVTTTTAVRQAAVAPVAPAPVAVARASVSTSSKTSMQVAAVAETSLRAKPAVRSAPVATVLASIASPTAAPARKHSATPVRTISANAAPVLASSGPIVVRHAAPIKPETPVVAFAPEPAKPTFPSSGGSRVMTSDASPVAQAWASFQ